jgi:hypothetical protein
MVKSANKRPIKVPKQQIQQILTRFSEWTAPEAIGKALKVKITDVLAVITSKRRSPNLDRKLLSAPVAALRPRPTRSYRYRYFNSVIDAMLYPRS